MLLQQPRLNSCRNGLEVIWNSPETNVELIWNTHGNIYKVYFNMSVTQVELFPRGNHYWSNYYFLVKEGDVIFNRKGK
jgi:hypothetical protein